MRKEACLVSHFCSDPIRNNANSATPPQGRASRYRLCFSFAIGVSLVSSNPHISSQPDAGGFGSYALAWSDWQADIDPIDILSLHQHLAISSLDRRGLLGYEEYHRRVAVPTDQGHHRQTRAKQTTAISQTRDAVGPRAHVCIQSHSQDRDIYAESYRLDILWRLVLF